MRPFFMKAFCILAAAFCLLGTGLLAGDKPADIPPELRPLARTAKEQFDRGALTEAEQTYRKMLERAPENLYALSNLGVVLFREKKYKDAEQVFGKVTTLEVDDGFSHCTLGIIYYSQGRYDAAIDALTKALVIDPNNATAHNYLGISASQKGWAEAAQKELESATSLDPNYADAQFNLAVFYATQNPPQKDKATSRYAQALKLGADHDADLEKIIDWHGDSGVPGKSAPPMASGSPAAGSSTPASGKPSVAASLPEEFLPLGRQAKVEFEKGNYLEAEKLYRQVLEKAPANLYALSNLGVVLFRAAKFKDAEKVFKRATTVAPEDGFSHCTLGIVYYSQGKFDDAVNELTKALAIDPANTTARDYLRITAKQQGGNSQDDKYDHPAPPPGPGDFSTPREKEQLEKMPQSLDQATKLKP